MEVFEGVDAYDPEDSPSVLSIGNFDGVHLAHREICRFIKAEAARRGGRSVILTFEPHPLSVVAPERRPPLMTTLEEKLARLEDQNVDAVVVEKFTPRLAQTEAGDFVRQIIGEGLRAALVAIGFNFRFGKGRAGNVEILQEVGSERRVRNTCAGPLYVRGEAGQQYGNTKAVVERCGGGGRTQVGTAPPHRGKGGPGRRAGPPNRCADGQRGLSP